MAERWVTLPIDAERRPPWLGDREVRIPETLARGPLDLDAAIDALESESWAPPMTTVTTKVPFAYDRLPARLRGLAATALMGALRVTRARRDPPWPIAPTLDVLRALRGDPVSVWPGDKRWALLPTVDVDSVAGLRRAPLLAEIAERRRIKLTYFIVGEAHEREPGIVGELRSRGHSIGSHDLRHDNQLAYLPPRERDDRLRRAKDLIERLGGDGFRSPSLIRSPALREAVAKHFAWDASVCDTDLEFERGVCTVHPFRRWGALQVPITLPMESSLSYTLRGPDAVLQVWKDKCAWIRTVGGLATLAVHAEPHLSGGRRYRGAFERFLDWALEQPDLAIVTPRDLRA